MVKKLKEIDYRNVTLKDLKRALKLHDSILSTFFYRKISLRITKILLPTGITPLQVTIISLFLGLIAGVLFLQGNYWLTIIGLIFLHFAYIFDHVDGEIARFKKIGSIVGAWVDQVTDRIKETAFFIGITLGMYKNTLDPLIVIFGMAALANLLMIGYIRSTAWFADFKKTSDLKITSSIHLGFEDSLFFLITITALLDRLDLLLMGFATVGALLWIVQFVIRYRHAKSS